MTKTPQPVQQNHINQWVWLSDPKTRRRTSSLLTWCVPTTCDQCFGDNGIRKQTPRQHPPLQQARSPSRRPISHTQSHCTLNHSPSPHYNHQYHATTNTIIHSSLPPFITLTYSIYPHITATCMLALQPNTSGVWEINQQYRSRPSHLMLITNIGSQANPSTTIYTNIHISTYINTETTKSSNKH